MKSLSKINDIANLPINSIEIQSQNMNNLDKIKKLISAPGNTNVTLKINNNSVTHFYKLNEKRKIDQKIISQLKNAGVALKIQ